MLTIDFNCDMGEGFGRYTMGRDRELLPHVTSANIACGFHAGDAMCMHRTVSLAELSGVGVGAHPGLPDLMGFGRRSMAIDPMEAKNYVKYQIGALRAFARGGKIQHVKPHGALYNMGVQDESLANAVAEAVKEVDPELILVGLAGSHWIAAGMSLGLRVAREVFADRAFNADGSLVDRRVKGAVLENVADVLARTLKMVKEGKVTAVTGREIPCSGDTLCLHGDTPGAVALAANLRRHLEEAGITVAPMGTFV